jgi:deoxyribonucleoside regulator
VAQRVSAETLAKAAYWYYVQDLSQKEVARRLGTSQSNVSRLMRAAREQGVVKFEIAYPIHRELDLEDALRSTYHDFGVRDVIVSQVFSDHDHSGNQQAGMLSVARSSAEWLQDNLLDGQTLGLFWGTTVKAMVDIARFDRRIDAHVVQLAGEWSVDPGLSGHNLVRDLGDKLGGRYTYFNAPAVAATAEEADSLLVTPEVKRSLDLARHADIALLGIGSFPTDTTRTFLDLARATKAEVDEAERKQVVGQFAGRFFDDQGKQVDLAIHRRLVSLDLAEVRGIPTIAAVAHGEGKTTAVRAALHGGLIDVLIVDPVLGRCLLD